jgi:hypothetical protein
MPDHRKDPPKPQRTEDERGGEPPSRQQGVFGRLPGTRPGVRSPRRQTGEQATDAELVPERSEPRGVPKSPTVPSSAGDPPKRHRAEGPPDASETPPGAAGQGGVEEPSPQAEHGGVEDLAWAGIAVAAEAATLGIRLLSRAMDAVRRPPDGR